MVNERTPQQIIGDYAYQQLLFEGYVVTRPAAPVEGLEVVAWRHPTAGWANHDYSLVEGHCLKVGPYPDPLVTRSQAEAIIAAKVEQERLRFEGDLDKWMKTIGAGITGFQPEAYDMMDLACQELVTLRADNAVLTARVKELELIRDSHSQDTLQALQGQQALETQLAAAREGVKYALANLRMSKRNEEFLASALQWSEPTAPCDANALEDRP